MIPKSIKPAPRHFTNKYTATSQVQSPPLVHSPLTQPPITQNSLPQSQTQSKIPIPPPAIAVTEHSETIPNSYKPPIVESAKTLAPKKSFFEELPIDLPKPAARAAPVKAINVPHIQKSPTVLQQQPTKPPPVNPYKPNPTVVSNTSTPNTPFRNPPSAQYAPPAPASGLVPPPISHTHLKPTQTFPSIQPQPPTQVQSQVQPQGQPHTPVQAHVQGHTGQVGQGQVPNINTNISRTSAGTATSPYVPNAGPYGPSNHKTHSRASSIVGAKGKEYNPYAPHSVQNTLPPAAARARGGSNPRGSIYSKPQQPASKITNPELLNHRQFPVFNWSNSLNSVTLIPNISTSAYEHHLGDSIKVIRTCELLKYNTMYETFPGPLVKGKTKKKDIEKWLEKNIERLINDSLSSELLLNQILLQLVRADGDYNSIELKKGLSSVLNPSVNYSATPDIQPSMKIAANAFKLDTSGVNTAFSLIQSGNIERAIEYCVSRGDWSLALVLANFSGPEKYAKVAGDFARNTFPFQKANNKVLHLMPLLLKVGAGNIKGAIEDLSVVPTEGEYANLHWREFVACVLISGTAKTQEFLIEFGKFIGQTGNNWANEICFALAGVPLSPVMFAYLGSESTTSMYCEVYEYILSISPNTSNVSTIGFPHLLPNKLRHASILADYGYYGQSQRYIDTINNIIKSLGTRSSILNEDLLHEFQNLIYRLSNTNSEDQSWFGNRISKVNLDKLWGQIDKFIGGEDAKSKSAGDGVFSKFSPSVSRTASTVDITTLNGNGNGNGKFQSPQFNSSASFATDYPSTLAQRGSLSHPILPSLVPSSSTTSVAKYAPAKVQLGSPKSHHISGFTPAYGGDGGDLSSIKKGSGRYTPGISGSSVSARATVPFSASSNYPYLNNTGHISTSSIGSQSVNPSVSQTPTNYAKRPSVTSVLSVESFAHQQHTRSPSIQSDVSMDYPQEFKSTPKRSYDEPSSLSPEKKEVPETINESPELKTSDSLTLNQQDGPSVEENEEKHQHQHQQEQEQEQEPVAPPPKVKKQITKANPYAPPGARDVKPVGRKSKYGPSTSSVSTSKYSVPAASSSNPYSSGGYKAPGTVPESESEPEPQPQPVEKVAKGEDIPVKSVNHHHEHHGNFGPYQPQPPYRPTKNIPNIDDSFDEIADESHDSGVLRTPGIKKSVLMDNINSGNGKESLFNNYHHEESNTPKFGLDFPIPGSPEFTSRANSVVGQPGLFSSRLSQSHQSVLYQQYEVEDDTVRDYVPMIEEDEEDEEDGDVEVAKQRKLEQEAKAKAEAEAEAAKKAKLASEEAQRKAEEAASKRKPTATEGGENSNGWFSGWLGKDDGKPKAIRAKLGKTQNPFYYDEKLKRWIDKSRPIEEQQAPTGPPPPPASKKPRITTSSTTGASAPPPGSGAPPPPGGVPSSSVPPSGALGTTPGAPPTSGPPPSSNSSTRSLANAGLDDLLSLGGTSSVGGGRKPKRGGRRTYVNVMEK
ncbi:Sec23-binding domain of Sec16-domain-containing protein [Scheffersomyces amazonensis]|uniref:Sec23-binding domain of Sec16-domain-containing protein n=1 Tax=Scheffersomyces amazonensis TaxID=1078765 RepID=UPI00315CD6BE